MKLLGGLAVLLAVTTLAIAPLPAAAAAAEPPPTVGMPQGNVQPAITPVTGVGAAATAAPVDDRVAVLVQNNSTDTVRLDRVTVTATSRGGGRVVRARTAKTFPPVVAPGELALAAVQFRHADAPPGSTVAARIRSTRVKPARASRALAVGSLALSAPKTGSVAQTMSATVTNPTSSWKARRPEVAVMCFGEARNPVAVATARSSARTLRPQEHETVSVPLTTLCPTYLVAARAT